MTFDPTKPVQTRGGLKAKIVDPDFNGCLLAVITLPSGSKTKEVFRSSGRLYNGVSLCGDLINVPEKHVRWVNFYRSPSLVTYHGSREDADLSKRQVMSGGRIACIRVEFEEGEGLP